MFRSFSRQGIWFVLLAAGGTIFQTSCNTIAADAIGGLGSSIANEYIGNLIRDWLGTSSGLPF